ncbi:hypothetical protein ACQEVS_09675 [Streptomyces sp. CA-181903]|uniref:hypothetical protein n=1 Tax=Streptomyces sp. CA-181903 TaxID=3240055 RepID=UPI003D8F4781
MSSSEPRIKIHVLPPDAHDDDVALTDVGVVNVDGERHLFLRPQSFYSAVRQVSSAMPDLPLEQVERLVRDHCEFKDFDELLGPPAEPAPPVDLPPHSEEPPAPRGARGRAKKWAAAAAVVPALVGAWAVGHFTGAAPASTAVSAPDKERNAARDEAMKDNHNLGPEPFTARDFKDFSVAGKISCSPSDDLEAECTDSDGMVMATKAATGPDSTIFTFSYGKDRLGLRIFATAEYARTWAMQDASRQLYPNMVLSGRYVLWGTDKERLKGYEAELAAAAKKPAASGHQASVKGGAQPLPPRLAALTLGTLGLDAQDVRTVLYSAQDPQADSPVLLAAQAVLGVGDMAPPSVRPGEADIVALAAGLEPSPETGPRPTPSGAGSASGASPSGDSSGTATGTAPATDVVAQPDPRPAEKERKQQPEQPTAPERKPEPVPGPEPEKPPTTPVDPAPVDPAPPVTQTPAPQPQQVPAPATAQPPTDGTAQEVPISDGQTRSEGDEGTLLALPQAWIAPVV